MGRLKYVGKNDVYEIALKGFLLVCEFGECVGFLGLKIRRFFRSMLRYKVCCGRCLAESLLIWGWCLRCHER
jgi:hypothetical protein